MPGKLGDFSPTAFIWIGVCFMGSGATLNAALHRSGAGSIGISLIGVGVVFMILGFAKKRELESEKTEDHDDDRPPPN